MSRLWAFVYAHLPHDWQQYLDSIDLEPREKP